MADSRIDELRKRLEKEPGSRLFAQLAEELRKAGELSEAVRVCRDGLQKQPTYHSARMTLARAFLDSGDLNAARPEFEAVLKAAPDNILASRLLGECLEGLGDLAGARARYKTTLAFTPTDKLVQGRLEAVDALLAAPVPPPAAPAALAHATEAAPAPPSVLEVEEEPGIEEDFKPIPLVAAEESFELEAAYEAPTTKIGSEPAAAFPAEPAGTVAEQPPDTEAEFVDFEAVAPYQPPPIIEVPSRVPLVAEPPEAAPAPPAVAPPAAPAPKPKEAPAELASPTLAELYFGQGHTRRAIEIYRQVVEREPANERSRARLIELMALERHLAEAERPAVPRAPDSGSASVPREARREALWRTIRHLEEMLAAVRKG